MSAKQLNPAYDGMTDQQVKRFKYWEFRTMAMCIFGYALFYFVRKNLSIAMPYLNEEMGISKSDLGLFLTLHGLIYGLSKFFNGIWGDRSNARYFLVTGSSSAASATCFSGSVRRCWRWVSSGYSTAGSRAWASRPARD